MNDIKLPFIISVIGPKRTGKTTFIKKWLDQALLDHFRYVVLFSPTAELSSDFTDLQDDNRITLIMKTKSSEFESSAEKLFDKLETLKKTDGFAPPTLLILDDCGTDPILNANSTLDKYCIRHRHAELSILAVGHSLRGTCGLPKAFRSQMDMAILFNPNSMSELETILKEVLFSEHQQIARRKAVEVYSEDYNFIVWRPAATYYEKLMINFTEPLIPLGDPLTEISRPSKMRGKRRRKNGSSTS